MGTEARDGGILVSAIGGFDSIGASCALVTLGANRVMFDCGIFVGGTDRAYPASLNSARPDVILLSHAHIDHIGALPIVAARNPNAVVYATPPTKTLALPMLKDAARTSQGKRKIYRESDAEVAASAIKTLNFNEVLDFRGLRICFRRAGHILGAATIIVEGVGKRVVYTGDFSAHSTRLTPGPEIPDNPEDCDVMFCETTYGGKKPQNDRLVNEAELITAVASIIRNGGRVLIPTFALGRAQEVITLLVRRMNEGAIPRVSIYVDGMVRQINELYAGLVEWVNEAETARLLMSDQAVKPITNRNHRLQVLAGNEACIIVASSGMLNGGASPIYAADIAGRADSAIYFVGYLDEESEGDALYRLKKAKLKLRDVALVPECAIAKFSLSAHADHGGIMRMVKAYRPRVFIPVHGEHGSRHDVASEVRSQTGSATFMPYNGQEFQVNPAKGEVMLSWSPAEVAAEKFLRSLDKASSSDTSKIQEELTRFLLSDKDGRLWSLDSLLWAVFRLSANYCSGDAWTSLSERAKFYRAIAGFLADRYPEMKEAFTKEFENSAGSFLANLVLYGVNRTYAGMIQPLKVDTLEQSQSLIVQMWRDFGIQEVSLVNLYHLCRIRAEWPADSEENVRFGTIFGRIADFVDILEEYPMISFLCVGNAVVGAVDGQIIIILVLPGTPSDTFSDRIERAFDHLSASRLIPAAGWKFDRQKLQPVDLSDVRAAEKGGEDVAKEKLRLLLKSAVEPYRKDIGGGVFALFTEIPSILERSGFSCTAYEKFIVATHTESGNSVLMVPDESGHRFKDFATLPGCIIRFDELAVTVGRLNSLWRPSRSEGEKNQQIAEGVITDYGWHAYLPETFRRKALDASFRTLDYQHLYNLLKYLETFTFHNLPHYGEVARMDREWLRSSYEQQRSPRLSAFRNRLFIYCGLWAKMPRFDRTYAVVL